jgi:hypothetical protein
MDFTKAKSDILKNYAEKLAVQHKIVFKKTVHGKNKSELLKFINEIQSKHGKIEFEIESINESKENLLEKARQISGFKKSYEKKSKEFLANFIKEHSCGQEKNNFDNDDVSPVHFDEFLVSPEMSLKDAVLKCFSEN